MRRVDKLVTAAQALVAHPVLHDFADHGAAGMPEDQARAGELLNAEEVNCFPRTRWSRARGLFQPGEVLIEILLREKRRAVDALQLGILLVAEPVGAGEADHLECLHAAGRGHVGAAAEVHELAIAIKAHLRARVR